MDSVPFSELTSLLYERPDLKLAQASVKASEADVRLQRSLAFPEVSVKGTYDKAGNFINDYWAIGLSVSLPIFNRNQGNIRAAKISVAQKAHKEEYARRQARMNYSPAMPGWKRRFSSIVPRTMGWRRISP